MTKTAQEAIKLLVASQELEKIAVAMLEAEGVDKEAFLGGLARAAQGVGKATMGAGRSAAKTLTPASMQMAKATKAVPKKIPRGVMSRTDTAAMRSRFAAPARSIKSNIRGSGMPSSGPRMTGIGG